MKGVNGMEGMAGMKEGKKGVEGMGCVKGMGGGWGCDGKGFRKVCRVHGWWTLRWGRDRRQVKYYICKPLLVHSTYK